MADAPQALQMALNTLNILVIDVGGITIKYQIDIDNPKAKNDEVTLQSSEGFEQTIVLGELSEIEHDFVLLEFPEAPTSGSYTLIHDPKEKDVEPFTIFKDVPFEILGQMQETKLPPAIIEEEPDPEPDAENEED